MNTENSTRARAYAETVETSAEMNALTLSGESAYASGCQVWIGNSATFTRSPATIRPNAVRTSVES